MTLWASLLRRGSFTLLAPRCLVCAEAGMNGMDLCAACCTALPWNSDACPRCGLPGDGSDGCCGQCLLNPPAFERTQAGLRYSFPVDRLLPRFKFHGDLAAGALLATLMQWTLDPEHAPQLLIPVPLHGQRLRQRGYDQALELGRNLSRSTRVPLCAHRLVRQRATVAQTLLGADDRQRNVAGAFVVGPGPNLPAHVALVDDVLTTGATVGECARVLLAAGVRRVDVWAVARAL